MLSHNGALKLQAAAGADGNGTALSLGGASQCALQISGTFSATVNFEATVDGTNWIAVALANLNSTTRARATTATAAGIFVFDGINGVQGLRARISSYASGAVDVVGYASE